MSNNNKILEELSEECVCPLCLELYDQPRLVECGHTFCDRCLRNYANSKNTFQLECPLCRKLFNRDINSLKIHIQLQNICDKLKKLNVPLQDEQNNTIINENMKENSNSNNEMIDENPPFNPEAEKQENPYLNVQNQPIIQNQYDNQYNNHQNNQQIHNQWVMVDDNQNNQQQTVPFNPNNYPYNPLLNNNQNNQQQQQGFQYSPLIENNNVDNPPNLNNNDEIPSDQPGYRIQDQDEISKIKTNIKKEKQREEKGFWGSIASFFNGKDLNLREGCGQYECLFNDFLIEKEEVPKLVEKWFENLWFKPVGFSKAATVQSNSCVQAFFPFKLYEVKTSTDYGANVHYTTTKNKKKTNVTVTKNKMTYTSGHVSETHKVIIFTSSQHYNIRKWVSQQNICLDQNTTIKPLPFNNMIEGKICYPQIENENSIWEEAKEKVDTHVSSECRSHATRFHPNSTSASLTHVNTNYTSIRSQIVYFPLYLVQYNYNNELFHCVVNGINGEVSGDRKYGTGIVGEIVNKGWNFISGLFGSKESNNQNNENNK